MKGKKLYILFVLKCKNVPPSKLDFVVEWYKIFLMELKSAIELEYNLYSQEKKFILKTRIPKSKFV